MVTAFSIAQGFATIIGGAVIGLFLVAVIFLTIDDYSRKRRMKEWARSRSTVVSIRKG